MLTAREAIVLLIIALSVAYLAWLYRRRNYVEPNLGRVLLYSASAFLITFLLQRFARESVSGYCTAMTLGYVALFTFAIIWGPFEGYAAGLGLGLGGFLGNNLPPYLSVATIITAVTAGALIGWITENHRETSAAIIATILGSVLIFSGESVPLWAHGKDPIHCLEPLATSLITGILAASLASYFVSSK